MTDNANFLERSELLIGREKLIKLSEANILIVGLGGVGSYAVESLARAGVGNMTIADGDVVDITNVNRQLQALQSTVGMKKTDLIKQRILDINPNAKIETIDKFLNPEEMHKVVDKRYDFVLDCIDSITPKINLIVHCKKNKLNVISSMGAGGKTNPKFIEITDIHETQNCTFTKDVRKRLKRAGYGYSVRVVYSSELMDKNTMKLTDGKNYKKSFYGTISYMPAMFGMTMASYVLRKIGNY